MLVSYEACNIPVCLPTLSPGPGAVAGPGRPSRPARAQALAGWESLTATERAVSLLEAEGLTNGAVAKRLYVSPHTVNTHLRHVFAKLDVSNRVGLAAVVHRSNE